jgi:ubiquinone/menaquinone biosynthesis C-methylase UbiE
MLEQARARLAGATASELLFVERTASEIDALPEEGFDAIAASLCLSEMSRSERRFVLVEARRRLQPGGRLVVGDEVRPQRPAERILHALLRGPQAALGWLLAGSVSRPLSDLEGELREAGFEVEQEQRWLLGALAVFVARRPS